jgi:hypothetical protein
MTFAIDLPVNFSTVPSISLINREKPHLREIREMRERQKAARHREEVRDQLRLGVRKSFVFLLVATAAMAFFWHRYQFFNGAFTVVHHMSAKIKNVGNSGSLHADTVNYEQEVNDITQTGSEAK